MYSFALPGSIAAEQYYSSIRVDAHAKRLRFKKVFFALSTLFPFLFLIPLELQLVWTTTLELLCGMIQWTSRSGENHSIVVGEGLEVGGEGCEIYCEGGGEKFYGLGRTEEEARGWVEMVKACQRVKQQELSLRKVAEKRLIHPTKEKTPVGIMRLVCNSGSVWSVDTTPMVSEGKREKKKTNSYSYNFVILQTLQIFPKKSSRSLVGKSLKTKLEQGVVPSPLPPSNASLSLPTTYKHILLLVVSFLSPQQPFGWPLALKSFRSQLLLPSLLLPLPPYPQSHLHLIPSLPSLSLTPLSVLIISLLPPLPSLPHSLNVVLPLNLSPFLLLFPSLSPNQRQILTKQLPLGP